VKAQVKEGQPHPLTRINKELGGKDEEASLGILLDRIGQDGWELVSHSMTEVTGDFPKTVQTWTFKRPAAP
jgi:hypothetical protein